ncbi:TIGR00153 family protein [Halorhodospira abdelmalekii]|nr:TIGR00153 family protein [Halorhodospira abdelmalekii]
MKSYFARIFGSSPVAPLQRHMEEVVECVEILPELFRASAAAELQRMRDAHRQIVGREHRADRMKKEIRAQLPPDLFMPWDRRDFLELLRAQDRIANKSKDIAGLMIGRQMQWPQPLVEPTLGLLDQAIDATQQAMAAVRELEELVETGFRGAELEVVETLLNKLDDVEAETDRRQVELRSELFQIERNLYAVDVMFLYQIIESIGTLADRAQQTGARFQILLAH